MSVMLAMADGSIQRLQHLVETRKVWSCSLKHPGALGILQCTRQRVTPERPCAFLGVPPNTLLPFAGEGSPMVKVRTTSSSARLSSGILFSSKSDTRALIFSRASTSGSFHSAVDIHLVTLERYCVAVYHVRNANTTKL